MEKYVEELKKRYRNYKFYVREPVLDIGGGNGSFLESQNIKKAIVIEGGNYKSYGGIRYIKADITKKLPDLKKKFNTIFIMEVLEHIKNPLYLLAQVYDLLEEEGICYIAIPYTKISPEHHHVCRWKLKEILNQTRKLGFIPKVIQKRRRFKGLAFWAPHCWLVLALKKKIVESNKRNIDIYKLEISENNLK